MRDWVGAGFVSLVRGQQAQAERVDAFRVDTAWYNGRPHLLLGINGKFYGFDIEEMKNVTHLAEVLNKGVDRCKKMMDERPLYPDRDKSNSDEAN